MTIRKSILLERILLGVKEEFIIPKDNIEFNDATYIKRNSAQ